MSPVGQRDGDAVWPYGSVVLGCGNFGGIGGARDFVDKGMSEEASLASMDEAAELGITLFDTAERYAAGESERIIGRWLRSRPSSITEQVRVSTKVGPPWVDGRDDRFDFDYVGSVFSGSLERLGLDAVEVLYTHAPDDHPARPSSYEPFPVETTLEALESLRADGTVSHLGASNVNAVQLRAALDAAQRLGVAGYEVIQNGYNLLDPRSDAEVRQLANENGLAYTAYSALGSGVLTGSIAVTKHHLPEASSTSATSSRLRHRREHPYRTTHPPRRPRQLHDLENRRPTPRRPRRHPLTFPTPRLQRQPLLRIPVQNPQTHPTVPNPVHQPRPRPQLR